MTSPKVPLGKWVECDESDWSPEDPLPKLKDLSCAKDGLDVLRAIQAQYPNFRPERRNGALADALKKESEKETKV